MATRQLWRPIFDDFLGRLTIESKDTGVSKLEPYGSQRYYLERICAGMDQGIRHFVCLKARQLGISTISLAIDLFWLYIHDGIQGALITDSDENKQTFKSIIERYIEYMPETHRVPVEKHNDKFLLLKNGSRLSYMSAGTRRGGGLGRSKGLNFIHATECSSWGDEEGLASLIAATSETAPNRLYMFESTARGFNLFYKMCERAQQSPSQMLMFIGWWTKEAYRLPPSSREYQHYAEADYSEVERELVAEVEEKYKYKITIEQVAWWRKKAADLMSQGEGHAEQEFPWTPAQAFQSTGRPFFNQKMVTLARRRSERVPFWGYRYHLGDSFLSTAAAELEQVNRHKLVELRIWQMPDPNGIYVIGADPAGSSYTGDSKGTCNYAIEVFRCFADRLIQVAEYANTDLRAHQFAWVLAHLCGTYRNVRVILDILGVGGAVYAELRHLQEMLASSIIKQEVGKYEGYEELFKVFEQLRWYLYHRQDSLGAGFWLNWKTNPDNKIQIFEQLNSSFTLGNITINSAPLVDEMQSCVRDGSYIGGDGAALDDRLFAACLAHRAWLDWERSRLIADGLTWTAVKAAEKAAQHAREQESQKELNIVPHIIQDFFRAKDRERAQSRGDWRF